MVKKFFFEEKYKLAATTLVASFFLFFWLNGPIQTTIEILRTEVSESRFAIPKLVENEPPKHVHSFNTIATEDAGGFGYGLILENKKKPPTYALLATVERNPGLSKELANKLLAHRKPFVSDTMTLELKSSFEMYFVLSEKSEERHIYLESEGVVQGIRGYAGPVNIGLAVAESGRIASLRHISSKETQSYLQMIQNAGFFYQFEKLKLASGRQQVDAVSGATLTSEAIAKTASKLIEKATPYPLSNYVETGGINFFSVEAIRSRSWIIHILVILLLFFYGVQKKWKKSRRSILILNLVSVVYIGFFLNNSFTYVSFIHPFVGTNVSSLIGLYALFCLLGSIWGKNTYCKYVCPFGNVQRLLLRISPIKSVRFFISNNWLYRIRGGLTLILLTGILLGLRDWSNFELFPDFFGMQATTLWFFPAVAILLLNLHYPLIWCRLLCPTGSILDFVEDVAKEKKK